MPDSPHLTMMRKSLAQCEEGIGCVSADHDREILEQDAAELRKDIKHLEKWEAKQGPIRMTGPALGSVEELREIVGGE